MEKSKKLGLGTAISTTVGLIVATSCLISLGTGISLSGKAFIIPLFAVLILNLFTAFSFSELNSLMPNVTGGLGQYTLAAFGPGLSIISTVATYVICTILAAGVEASMFGIMLQEMFGLNATVFAVLIILAMLVVNITGIGNFAKVQNFAVVLLIGSMVVMAVMGCFKIAPQAALDPSMIQTAPVTDISGLFSLSALAFWLFIGVEFVIPISKDLKNPKRDIPLAMILGLVILFVVQAVMGIGMANYVPLDVLGSDIPHISYAVALVGGAGKYWMGFVTILAAVSSLNSILGGCSRILCGLAQGGMAPKLFTKENKKKSPWISLIFLSLILLGVTGTGISTTSDVTFLIMAASCFWLVGYAIAHLDVLIFRKKYPERKRDFKLKLLHLPQLIGIAGSFYMIWNIAEGETRTRIYKVFGVLGAILVTYSFIWVKVIMKEKYFKAYGIDKVIEIDKEANPEFHEDETELVGSASPAFD